MANIFRALVLSDGALVYTHVEDDVYLFIANVGDKYIVYRVKRPRDIRFVGTFYHQMLLDYLKSIGEGPAGWDLAEEFIDQEIVHKIRNMPYVG